MKINKPNKDIKEATLLKLLSITIHCLLIVGRKRINFTIRNKRKVLNTLTPAEFDESLIEILKWKFSITSKTLMLTTIQSNTL
jgi:hypothetical protein